MAETARKTGNSGNLTSGEQRSRLSQPVEGCALHRSLSLHLRGLLDEVRLVHALELLVSQYPALRLTVKTEAAADDSEIRSQPRFHSRFGQGSGQRAEANCSLEVQPSVPLPLECRDLSWLNAGDSAEEWKSILRSEASVPFELYRGPFFRTLLVRMSPRHSVLVFTTHPAIAGASAITGMMAKLAAIYLSLGSGNLDETATQDATGPGQGHADSQVAKGYGWSGLRPAVPAHAVSVPDLPSAISESSSVEVIREQQHDSSVSAFPLPADFPRDSTQAYIGATHSIRLGAEPLVSTHRSPSNGCAEKGNASAMAAFAAFALWLHRTTGQDDVVFGAACGFGSNFLRDAAERSLNSDSRQLVQGVSNDVAPRSASFCNLPGLTVPGSLPSHGLQRASASMLEDLPLPFRSLLLPQDNATTFQARLRQQFEEIDSYRKMTAMNPTEVDPRPISFLKQQADGSFGLLGSSTGHLPGWAYNQFHIECEGKLPGFADLTAELVWNSRSSFPADIALFFRIVHEKPWLDCNYNAALFRRETITRWAAEIDRLLRAMLEQPEQPLSHLAWVSSAERHSLLFELNRTARPYARHSSIQDVFERQVFRTPDAVALVNEEGTLTYEELNEKANQLARFLRRYGVGRGERIAVMAERSLGSIVGALAALKAGCAYVPIDPRQPATQIEELVKLSQPAAIVTQARFASLLPQQFAPVVLLDDDWAAVATEPMENLALPIAAEAPACVLHRRDVAGSYRGILLPHRAFVRLVQGSDYLNFGGDEVFLQLAGSTEDAWALEVWGPLLNGGQLAILPPGWQAPVQIGSAIEHYRATTLCLNPTDLQRIIVGQMDALAPLKQIVTATGGHSPALLRLLLQQYPRLKLIRGFGPAENGTLTCVEALTLASVEDASDTTGRPVANTRVYILDEHRELVRIGRTGELHVAGDGLAIGYLHAPEVTDQRFFKHTFAPGMTERLFRTGNLARYRADGKVELLGAVPEHMQVESTTVADQFSLASGNALRAVEPESETNGLETVEFFVAD